jgi:hypothetical protein
MTTFGCQPSRDIHVPQRGSRRRNAVELLALAGGWWLLACGGSSGGQQCKVPLPTSCPQPALHYTDVKPIIDQRCTSCHSGLTDQWPLTDYKHVSDWFDIIPPMVSTCQMPPPDAGVPITIDERTKILTWLHCGFPE